MASLVTRAGISALAPHHIAMMACPACGDALHVVDPQGVQCGRQHFFPDHDGVPLLFWPNDWDGTKMDVTPTVRQFYEQYPFPNYEQLDTLERLAERARKSVFACWLDEATPYGAHILEIGCGTGQLSNFLGMTWSRTVFGSDLSVNSLTLGEQFRRRHGIDGVAFLQMNLFLPAFRPEAFDVVICNGVLHHTSDPWLGFQSISRLVKPGGFIIVGLYNRYGRLWTHLRRAIFRLFGDRFRFLDPRLRDTNVGAARKHIWFVDQYRHAHESTHTIDEVLRWFARTGFEFTSSIPKPTIPGGFSLDEKLLESHPAGTRPEHVLVQLGMMITGREGGFFVTIGRKKGASQVTASG